MSITVQSVSRFAHPGTDTLTQWAIAARKQCGKEAAQELVIRVVDTDEMASLNRQFRGKAGPTNVLSFDCDIPANPQLEMPLGDIAICAPVVIDESASQDKPTDAHWCHMVIHGTAHLCGYDHENEQDAQRMETLETEILDTLGYPAPY